MFSGYDVDLCSLGDRCLECGSQAVTRIADVPLCAKHAKRLIFNWQDFLPKQSISCASYMGGGLGQTTDAATIDP